MASHPIPRYAELPVLPGTDDAYAWEVWPAGDQHGTLNFIGEDEVRRASTLVRTGQVVVLNLPLDQPAPGLFPERRPPTRHEATENGINDDHLVDLYLHFSTQWDALRHVGHRSAGFYGGRPAGELGHDLGIDQIARRGIVARGVLLDVAAHLADRGYRPDVRAEIGPALLDEVATEQGVELAAGDVLLLRTGWLAWYLDLGDTDKQRLIGTVHGGPGGLNCAGLAAGAETARWLWDHRIAAVAADNVALEALPVHRPGGFLHRRLLALLGMPLGELWFLEDLADHCAALGRHEFLLTSAPLWITGGTASPANALAIL